MQIQHRCAWSNPRGGWNRRDDPALGLNLNHPCNVDDSLGASPYSFYQSVLWWAISWCGCYEAIFVGSPINMVLFFSPEHYVAAAEAFLRGIERRIATPRTQASVRVQR